MAVKVQAKRLSQRASHQALGYYVAFVCIPGLAVLLIHKCASAQAIAVCAVIFRSFNNDCNWVEIVELLVSPTGEPRGDVKKISP